MPESKGTIATGGTAQNLYTGAGGIRMAAIQNNSSANLTVSLEGGTPDATGPLIIPAGAFFSTPPGMPLGPNAKVWGGTTGQAYSVWTY